MSPRTRLLAPLTSALAGVLVAGSLTVAPTPAAFAGPLAGPGARPAQDGPLQTERPREGRKVEPDAVFQRSSYLCYGYQDCREKGMGNAGYAQHMRTMYWRMYSGHNCTNYAAYRMVKSGLPNERPWSGGGNATYWGTSMPRITDGVPRVGAVAWWKANTGPAGSAGHVAYVEQVVSADEIIISQSSWGGDFSWAVVTRGSGNWPVGFIHFNDVPMVNAGPPVISGAAKVGSSLTASSGRWRPSGVQVSYQWYADGQKLKKSKRATIRLTQARLGQRLTVTATATKLGYPATSVTSAPTEAVLPGQISNTVAPAVRGQAKVDETLTLDTGTWSPKPDSLAVQWYADGQPIEGIEPGATSLTLTPDLVDTAISATVTASRTGFDPVVATTAPTAQVAPGTFRVTTLPSIVGTPKLGQTLSVETGAYSPSDSAVAVGYQWLRDGEPVLNATGPTYQISNLDLGARITARITLSRAGYTAATADSPATVRVRTDPRLTVALDRVRKRSGERIKVQVTVTAPGVETVTGPVVVRIGGVRQQVDLRANGTARVTLTGMRPGERTLRVRYAGSDTVTGATYTRAIRVR